MDQNLRQVYEEFSALVRSYKDLLESVATIERGEFLTQLQIALADLYAAGLRLPEPDIEAEPDIPEAPRQFLQEATLDALQEKLGEGDYYWHVFDPYKKDEGDPTRGWLTDDLTDIYSDLVRTQALTEQGATIAVMVWDWRFSLQIHWGYHVTDALRALHWLRAQ